jgi:hypothetical protein
MVLLLYSCMHVSQSSFIREGTQIYTHTNIHTYICTYMTEHTSYITDHDIAFIQTYMHAYLHTYRHTDIHITYNTYAQYCRQFIFDSSPAPF